MGRRVRVFAGETRPFLQGSRLTVYELMSEGIDVTLVVDSAVASLMKQAASMQRLSARTASLQTETWQTRSEPTP